MSEFKAVSYTNEFGQVINPGDRVIYVGTGYAHFVSVNQGIFDGVNYYRDKIRSVRVSNVPDRRWKWNAETEKGEYADILRTATLPLCRVYKFETPLAEFSGKTI